MWSAPDPALWRAWKPEAVAALLSGLDAPWCVVGGWAVDLFLGRQTRGHDDLEIATTRAGFPTLRSRLAPFSLFLVANGKARGLASGEEPPPDHRQFWVFDEQSQAWCFDVIVEPGDDRTWVYRRDPAIHVPRRAITSRTPEGIPYLDPEAVLLFKSRQPRPRDEADFEACLPLLSQRGRGWLRERLPVEHPWRTRLGAVALR